VRNYVNLYVSVNQFFLFRHTVMIQVVRVFNDDQDDDDDFDDFICVCHRIRCLCR
jgi:hypothetical protein